jgi:hypothetical protein
VRGVGCSTAAWPSPNVGRDLQVFALAGTVALALLILLLGCVFDETDRGGTWWSLFTALCYLMAITSWLLFQPGPRTLWTAAAKFRLKTSVCAGFICATDAASLGMEENGICGTYIPPPYSVVVQSSCQLWHCRWTIMAAVGCAAPHAWCACAMNVPAVSRRSVDDSFRGYEQLRTQRDTDAQ